MQDIIDEKNQAQTSWVLIIYFALKPLYLWSSGMMQISDIFLVISTVYLIFVNRGRLFLGEKGYFIIKFFSILVAYQFAINLIWSIWTSDSSMIKVSFYYIFNFYAFTMCVFIGNIIGADGMKKSMALGSFISILITMVGVLTYSGASSRNIGFFNNPNQLGYYSIIILTIVIYCRDFLKKYQKAILFIGSAYSVIASLSKAAIIGYIGLLIIYILFFQEKRSTKKIITQILLLFIVLAAIYLLFFSNNSFVLSNPTLLLMRYRILNMMSENDSNLNSGRGYGRVFELGTNFIWGMGEGGYDRFLSRTGAELHSTFVNLLVSYGLIGLLGYLYLLKKSLGNGKKLLNCVVVLMGILLYSITHNGVRNTLVWIIIATMLIENSEELINVQKNE